MAKRQKAIKKADSSGKIYWTDGKILNVRYFYVVSRITDDEVDTSDLVGQLEIRGAVEVIEVIETSTAEDTVDLTGKTFTLKTKDGRCIDAQVTKGNWANRQWEFISTGPQILVPC